MFKSYALVFTSLVVTVPGWFVRSVLTYFQFNRKKPLTEAPKLVTTQLNFRRFAFPQLLLQLSSHVSSHRQLPPAAFSNFSHVRRHISAQMLVVQSTPGRRFSLNSSVKTFLVPPHRKKGFLLSHLQQKRPYNSRRGNR